MVGDDDGRVVYGQVEEEAGLLRAAFVLWVMGRLADEGLVTWPDRLTEAGWRKYRRLILAVSRVIGLRQFASWLCEIAAEAEGVLTPEKERESRLIAMLARSRGLIADSDNGVHDGRGEA